MIHAALITASEIFRLGIDGAFAKIDDISLMYATDEFFDCGTRALPAAPDVVIVNSLSSSLPKASDLKRFIGSLRSTHRDVGFLFVADSINRSRYEFARHLGARGFCLQSVPVADLIEGVRVVARGETYIHPDFARQVADSNLVYSSLEGRLNKRHMDVLHLMLLGCTNGEIAELLYISVPTVKTHMKTILRALDARDRTQAVTRIYQGLLGEAERQSIFYG